MVGGGAWEQGEWTDDTSMAIAIAEVASTGADLRDEAAQDAIVARWLSHKLLDSSGCRSQDSFTCEYQIRSATATMSSEIAEIRRYNSRRAVTTLISVTSSRSPAAWR